MPKFNFTAAAAFAPQSAEGSYDSTLDTISATLSGDPDGTDDGLLLGDPESGIGESGLSLTITPRRRDKAAFTGGFTRPISDLLSVDLSTFSFSFPFCGNRKTVSGAPADADAAPLRGVEALLEGVGWAVSDWSGGTGKEAIPASPPPISGLIYINGVRLELLDCRVPSLSISYTAGGIAIATASIVVGSIKDPTDNSFTEDSLPTLDFGEQATVSAPTIETVGHGWGGTRGFQELTIELAQSITDIGDSNEVNGTVKEVDDKTVSVSATLFGDDFDAVNAAKQAWATAQGDLQQLSFTVGSAMADTEPVLAHRWTIPDPELVDWTPARLGSKAGDTVSLIARGTAANSDASLILL